MLFFLQVEDRRAESLFGKGFEFAGQGHKLKIMKTKKPSDCQRLLFENQDNKLSKATTSKLTNRCSEIEAQ